MRYNSTIEILFEQILSSIQATVDWSSGAGQFDDIPDSVERELLRIVELMRMLPESTRAMFESGNYRRIMAMRNAIIHSYLGRNNEGMIRMIRSDLPFLQEQIRNHMSTMVIDRANQT